MLHSNDKKMAGVFLTEEVQNYLSLHSLANRTSKSGLIECLVMNWYAVQIQENSEMKLIKKIAHYFDVEWKAVNSKRATTFDQFKGDAIKFLHKKGLSETQITLIFEKMTVCNEV